MNIVFCTDTLGRGGKERQMAIITRNLLARGHQLNWITQRNSRENNYLADYELDPSIVQETKSNSYFFGMWALRKQLKQLQPDLVMGWDIKSCFWLLVLNPICSWVFVNGSIRHGVRKNNLQHRFRTWVAKFSPYVIANTKAGLNVNLMKPSKTRKVIYNAIDSQEPNQDNSKEEKARVLGEVFEPADQNFNGPILLSVANLLVIKDYPTVIKSLAKVDFDFRYLVAGEGPERPMLEGLIKDLGLETKVALLGRRTDINRLLSISDIFINSSKGEGCSNAILEALSHGKFILASKVGGTPEILPPSLGAFFEFRNEASFLAGIHAVWKRRNEKDQQLKACKEHMKAFSNETITRTFEETFLNWTKS